MSESEIIVENNTSIEDHFLSNKFNNNIWQEWLNKRENIFNNIDDLANKYQDNPYILKRLIKHFEDQLSSILETGDIDHKQREERKNKLLKLSDEFISSFLEHHLIFYLPASDIYVKYDDENFNKINEDDIQYMILSTISHQLVLMPWKHKIKLSIMKKIRERTYNYAIPESCTIQSVIDSFYPSIFQTRNEAKYFITLIGDVINKKNQNLIYLINPRVKSLIQKISADLISLRGNHISLLTSQFKFKHHEHNYNDCRILAIQGNGTNQLNTKYDSMNLFFVANHYSNRYGSGDEFLNRCALDSPVQRAIFLKNYTQETLCELFIKEAFEPASNNSNNNERIFIDMKNVLYIWKKFLDNRNIPNVIFGNNLKKLLLTFNLPFDSKTETFVGITSKFLPSVHLFLKFWDENMIILNDNNLEHLEDNNEFKELEIDEIGMLFRSWVRRSKQSSPYHVGDEVVLDMIRHFYPNIQIEEDKYILGIQCSMWNKYEDIESFLFNLDVQRQNNNESPSTKSLYNTYSQYCNEMQSKTVCIANKKYFEKVALELYPTMFNN